MRTSKRADICSDSFATTPWDGSCCDAVGNKLVVAIDIDRWHELHTISGTRARKPRNVDLAVDLDQRLFFVLYQVKSVSGEGSALFSSWLPQGNSPRRHCQISLCARNPRFKATTIRSDMHFISTRGAMSFSTSSQKSHRCQDVLKQSGVPFSRQTGRDRYNKRLEGDDTPRPAQSLARRC